MKKNPIGAGMMLLPLLVGACAMPADSSRMSVQPTSGQAPFPAALQAAMCVRTVTGGESTNPLWVSKVGDAEFRDALANSLKANALDAGAGTCRYPTDANLLGLSQPAAGFSLEVVSHVNYKVYDAAGAPILLETVNAPYTAGFSESAIAIIRLQRANEGSVRVNIQEFLDRLRRVVVK